MTDSKAYTLPPDLRLRPPKRRYAGMFVGGITLIGATAAFFCDMRLSAAPVEQTLVTALVVVLCCFVMYISLFDAGRQKAMLSETYEKAEHAYRESREKARTGQAGGSLDRWCRDYRDRELRDARERLLGCVGVSYGDFTAYLDGTMPKRDFRALPRVKRRALKGALRAKPVPVTAHLLLSSLGTAKKQIVLSVYPDRARRTVTALIPTVCGSLITVAVTLTGNDLSAATVIMGLLRLVALAFTGLRGYSAGQYGVIEDECAVLESKRILLETYLCERESDAEK